MQQGETETQEITTVSEVAPTQVVKTTRQVTPPVQTEHPQKVYQKKKAIFRTYQVIWYILGLVEVLLVFRTTLKVFGASPASGFVSLIYAITDPLALPFAGVFGVTVTQSSVFEWSTIVAGFVYLLVGFGLIELIQLVKPTNPEEVEQAVDNQ